MREALHKRGLGRRTAGIFEPALRTIHEGGLRAVGVRGDHQLRRGYHSNHPILEHKEQRQRVEDRPRESAPAGLRVPDRAHHGPGKQHCPKLFPDALTYRFITHLFFVKFSHQIRASFLCSFLGRI